MRLDAEASQDFYNAIRDLIRCVCHPLAQTDADSRRCSKRVVSVCLLREVVQWTYRYQPVLPGNHIGEVSYNEHTDNKPSCIFLGVCLSLLSDLGAIVTNPPHTYYIGP